MSRVNFEILDKAYGSAPMSESKGEENSKKKKKLINISEEWEIKIKKHYKGTLNSYITMSIYERMKKDGII
jgi:hypothetical protein